MLDPASVYIASSAMDVTDLVVQRLNAKITSISFERERLPEGQQAAAAAAPPPSAPAPTRRKK
jgi:hypothetical protein